MGDKAKVNWQLIAAAAAGVAAVGLGLYLLLRTPDVSFFFNINHSKHIVLFKTCLY